MRAANTPRPAGFAAAKRRDRRKAENCRRESGSLCERFPDSPYSYLTIRRFCIKIYYYRRDDGAGVRPAAAGQRRTPLTGSVRAERPEDSAGAGAATPAACPDAETRGKRKRQRRFEFGWHHEAMRLSSQNREDGRFFDTCKMFHTRFSRLNALYRISTRITALKYAFPPDVASYRA